MPAGAIMPLGDADPKPGDLTQIIESISCAAVPTALKVTMGITPPVLDCIGPFRCASSSAAIAISY